MCHTAPRIPALLLDAHYSRMTATVPDTHISSSSNASDRTSAAARLPHADMTRSGAPTPSTTSRPIPSAYTAITRVGPRPPNASITARRSHVAARSGTPAITPLPASRATRRSATVPPRSTSPLSNVGDRGRGHRIFRATPSCDRPCSQIFAQSKLSGPVCFLPRVLGVRTDARR